MFNKIDISGTEKTFVTKADLEGIASYYSRAAARLEAAEKLSASLDALAQGGFEAAFASYPYLSQVGEAGDTLEKKEKCLRDIKYYLRLIQYCLVAGSTGPLDEFGIAGQREVYRALGLPTSPYVTALAQIKNSVNLHLSPEAAREFRSYTDYAINSLS